MRGWGGGGFVPNTVKFEKRGLMYFSYSVAGGLPWSEREEPWIQFVVADFPDRLEDRRKEGHNKAEKQAPIIANRILYFANASLLFPTLLKKSDEIPTDAAEETTYVSDFP